MMVLYGGNARLSQAAARSLATLSRALTGGLYECRQAANVPRYSAEARQKSCEFEAVETFLAGETCRALGY